MPIYEFYCKKCHTIYKFFSRTINTEKIPLCPNCDSVSLQRMMSGFATPRDAGHANADEGAMADIDEAKLEKAMAMLSYEAEHLNEDDPRQTADLMRKLSDATGFKMGPGMEEALSRLEKGEDPDQIEAELGDLLQSEDPFIAGSIKGRNLKKNKPNRDDTLYDL